MTSRFIPLLLLFMRHLFVVDAADKCQMVIEEGICFNGNTFSSFKNITTPNGCCDACQNSSQCTHWTLNLDDDDPCRLKSGTSGKPKKSENCTSAITPLPPSPPPTPFPPPHPPPLGYRPHIMIVLADDFGHNNVGFTNGNPEAHSPHLDELAASGIKLDRHYVYKYCSPTRSSLMSGRLPLHVNQNNPSSNGGGIDIRMHIIPQRLKQAGYVTHHTGKWHLGETAAPNLPVNRGFDSSIGYLGGAEDHWTQRISAGVDLWEGQNPAWGKNGTYGAFTYTSTVVKNIQDHNISVPMFYYVALQNTHNPTEVPDSYINKSIDKTRQTYHGMVSCLDESVHNITDALKSKGMWKKTLFVLSADNGGASSIEGCHSSNYPLRGGKHTDFEGGVRAAAFVAGGVLPRGGVTESGYIHVCDWYATFAYLAGINPSDPIAGLPDIDSLNMWSLLKGSNATSPRVEIPLSASKADSNFSGWVDPMTESFTTGEGLIIGDFKLVLKNPKNGIWQGPQYPNTSKCPAMTDPGCPKGCLFNIIDDPTEHIDLSKNPKYTDIFQKLMQRQIEIRKTVYQTGWPGNYTKCKDMKDIVKANHGFIGPRCTQ